MPVKLKIFIVFLVLGWTAVFVLILTASLPYNALSDNFFKTKKQVNLLIPEGWGFFTRNPQEVRTYFLIEKNGQYLQDERIRNATFHNFWGINRIGRIVANIYRTDILSKIPAKAWYKTTDEKFSKLNFRQVYIHPFILKISRNKYIEMPKEIIIIRKKIVPWAYRRFTNKTGDSVMFTKVNLNP